LALRDVACEPVVGFADLAGEHIRRLLVNGLLDRKTGALQIGILAGFEKRKIADSLVVGP
jgi:hypothetical protein